VADAVKKADIVILAIPFGGVVPLLKENAAALEGKIIIDPSNPFKFENGDFKKIIGEKETAGEINAAATPKNAKFVKALGTLGAENLSAAAFRSPKKATLFYASDDTSVNQTIEQLIKELGFDPLRVGNIDQSIRIEIHGDLHQVTALPDPVSLEEAKKLL
jgi:predicted dinucleotide-binding enzyme